MTPREALQLVLGQIDYTNGARNPFSMVAAALPEGVIQRARDALAQPETGEPIGTSRLHELAREWNARGGDPERPIGACLAWKAAAAELRGALSEPPSVPIEILGHARNIADWFASTQQHWDAKVIRTMIAALEGKQAAITQEGGKAVVRDGEGDVIGRQG